MPIQYEYYPDKQCVINALENKEQLSMLVSFNGTKAIISQMNVDTKSSDTDKYFKLILNNDYAEWEFMCPADYKQISDDAYRKSAFYTDGLSTIASVLADTGIFVGIDIPSCYRQDI